MGNPFVHVELASTDLGKSKDFYSKLFDWQLEDMTVSDMDYTVIKVGEGTGGGMMKHPMPGASSAWLPYVLVDDIKAATEKAKSLGAQIMRDCMNVGEMGALSVIVDPTGAHLGLWQTKKK